MLTKLLWIITVSWVVLLLVWAFFRSRKALIADTGEVDEVARKLGAEPVSFLPDDMLLGLRHFHVGYVLGNEDMKHRSRWKDDEQFFCVYLPWIDPGIDVSHFIFGFKCEPLRASFHIAGTRIRTYLRKARTFHVRSAQYGEFAFHCEADSETDLVEAAEVFGMYRDLRVIADLDDDLVCYAGWFVVVGPTLKGMWSKKGPATEAELFICRCRKFAHELRTRTAKGGHRARLSPLA